MFSITKKQADRWLLILGIATAVTLAGAIFLLVYIGSGHVLAAM